jgi:hypothetical protein
MSCSERDVSDFGSSVGNSKGHFMIGSGLLPGWRALRDSRAMLETCGSAGLGVPSR